MCILRFSFSEMKKQEIKYVTYFVQMCKVTPVLGLVLWLLTAKGNVQGSFKYPRLYITLHWLPWKLATTNSIRRALQICLFYSVSNHPGKLAEAHQSSHLAWPTPGGFLRHRTLSVNLGQCPTNCNGCPPSSHNSNSHHCVGSYLLWSQTFQLPNPDACSLAHWLQSSMNRIHQVSFFSRKYHAWYRIRI